MGRILSQGCFEALAGFDPRIVFDAGIIELDCRAFGGLYSRNTVPPAGARVLLWGRFCLGGGGLCRVRGTAVATPRQNRHDNPSV